MNEFPQKIIKAFSNIQKGMELFIKNTLKTEIDDNIVSYTLKNLMSAENIPEDIKDKCNKVIAILKDNEFVINMFIKGMRIKTMLLGKLGMMIEGGELRTNLLNYGISISDDKSELPKPEMFFDVTKEFYEKCIELYDK